MDLNEYETRFDEGVNKSNNTKNVESMVEETKEIKREDVGEEYFDLSKSQEIQFIEKLSDFNEDVNLGEIEDNLLRIKHAKDDLEGSFCDHNLTTVNETAQGSYPLEDDSNCTIIDMKISSFVSDANIDNASENKTNDNVVNLQNEYSVENETDANVTKYDDMILNWESKTLDPRKNESDSPLNILKSYTIPTVAVSDECCSAKNVTMRTIHTPLNQKTFSVDELGSHLENGKGGFFESNSFSELTHLFKKNVSKKKIDFDNLTFNDLGTLQKLKKFHLSSPFKPEPQKKINHNANLIVKQDLILKKEIESKSNSDYNSKSHLFNEFKSQLLDHFSDDCLKEENFTEINNTFGLFTDAKEDYENHETLTENNQKKQNVKDDIISEKSNNLILNSILDLDICPIDQKPKDDSFVKNLDSLDLKSDNETKATTEGSEDIACKIKFENESEVLNDSMVEKYIAPVNVDNSKSIIDVDPIGESQENTSPKKTETIEKINSQVNLDQKDTQNNSTKFDFFLHNNASRVLSKEKSKSCLEKSKADDSSSKNLTPKISKRLSVYKDMFFSKEKKNKKEKKNTDITERKNPCGLDDNSLVKEDSPLSKNKNLQKHSLMNFFKKIYRKSHLVSS